MYAPTTPRRLRLAAFAVLAAVALLFLAFTGATVQNYTEVVLAKLQAEVSLQTDTVVVNPDGEFGETSRFLVWMNFTVSNPSSRALRMWVVDAKAWVRDYEVEDGLAQDRAFRDDVVRVETEEGLETRYYHPVFIRTFSYLSEVTLAEPGTNTTFPTLTQMNALVNPTTTQVVASIYDHAASVRGLTPEQVEWHYFAVVRLMVHDVPRDYRGINDAYLLRLPLVVRVMNHDLSA